MQQELTKKSMEVLLALHGTASQAHGFILLDVLHRFEEDVALDSACGCVHMGVISGHCAPRATRHTQYCSLPRESHCTPRASRVTARRAPRVARRARHRAPRASSCARRALLLGGRAHALLRVAARFTARRAGRAGCTLLIDRRGSFIIASMIWFSGGTIGPN